MHVGTYMHVTGMQVLALYPGTIRRRILRHLYLRHMAGTYLLANCRQKFLDALLAAARVELYMPGVRSHLHACTQF